MKKIAVILALVMTVGACATVSREYRLGATAEMNKQFDMAIKYYEQAALANPKESVYRIALFRAKMSAALYHLQTARGLTAQGKKKEAQAEYGLALSYDPANQVIAGELAALNAPPPAKVEKQAPEMLTAPVQLKSTGGKLSINFRTPVSLKSILETLGRTSGVTFIYDDTYRDANLAVDLTGKDLDQAINYLCIASKNFSRIVDEKTVIIAPDNFTMRAKYELLVIRTFYLSNINAQDVQLALVNMIKTQTKIPTIQIDKTLNSITIRDTPQAIALAEKLLRAWDKAPGEVMIDIEIMEVDRTKLRNLGIDLSQGSLAIRLNPATGVSDSGWISLGGLKLGDKNNYEIMSPQAVVQFLEADANTKIIAQPRVRGLADQEMKYLVGQKVPIPTASFTPIMAGGSNAQPIVSYERTDVGIQLTIKPRIHLEGEVTMEVEIKVSSIAGSGVAGIPIINTREIKNVLRLKDGETNLLAGLLRDEERKSIGGIVGLKDLPILGSLFSTTQTTIDQSDVVLTITPTIIRPLRLTDQDLKPFWVDPNNITGLPANAQALGEEALAEQAGISEGQAEAGDEAGANALYLAPASFEVPKDREFRINVELASEKEIGNMSLNLAFNPQNMALKEIIEGGVTKQMGGQAKFLGLPAASGCTLGFSAPQLGRGFKGQGTLAVLVFTAVGPGEATISIAGLSALGVDSRPVVLSTGEAKVLVR